MNNVGTKLLETKRLILRRGNMDDASQIYNNYGKDPVVSKYVVWNKHETIKDAEDLMEKWVKSYEDDCSYKWVVILKQINEVIGSISAVKVNKNYKTVEVGYCFGSKWWNNGFATESLRRVIKFFFEEVEVETIYANYISNNRASGRVMEKSGMKHDGTLRNRMIDKNTNKHVNLEAYSITKEDYFK